jgi:hypothetical protein
MGIYVVRSKDRFAYLSVFAEPGQYERNESVLRIFPFRTVTRVLRSDQQVILLPVVDARYERRLGNILTINTKRRSARRP